MSESSRDARDATGYRKLPPPKSLRGDEESEVVWEIITKRYPKAAPLLCEMETAIEHAESLLQQLRSPYTQGLERSSSFQLADSEDDSCVMGDESAMELAPTQSDREERSMNCEAEDVVEDDVASTNAVETQISGLCLSDDDDPDSELKLLDSPASLSSPELSLRIAKLPTSPGSSRVSSPPAKRNPETSRPDHGELRTYHEEEDRAGEDASPRRSPASAFHDRSPNAEIDNSSLEGRAKVVGEEPVFAERTVEIKLDDVNASDRARKLDSLKSAPMHQMTRLKLLGQEEEFACRFSETVSTVTKVIHTKSHTGREHLEEEETPIHREDSPDKTTDKEVFDFHREGMQELGDTRGTNRPFVVEHPVESPRQAQSKLHTGRETQGSGDENSPSIENSRSPVIILQEYADECGVLVQYNLIRDKNSVTIKCCFAGYKAECCGKSSEEAKTKSAVKVLRMLAGSQMDEALSQDLNPLTKERMGEIIALGTEELETAIRKLYKLCLERRMPEPKYNVKKKEATMGCQFTVICKALDHTATGYGTSLPTAKRIAAEALLKKYKTNAERRTEVN